MSDEIPTPLIDFEQTLVDCIDRYKTGPVRMYGEMDSEFEQRARVWRGYLRNFIALVHTKLEQERRDYEARLF